METEETEDGYETDETKFATKEEQEDCYKEEKVFLGSDVSALHPSCTAKMAGEVVNKAILKTRLQFEGVDYRELAKYVAINCRRLEVCESGLRRVVPVRAKQRGAKRRSKSTSEEVRMETREHILDEFHRRLA